MSDRTILLEGELDRLYREMATMIARDRGEVHPCAPRREHLQAAIDAIAEWETLVEAEERLLEPQTPFQALLHRHFEVSELILELAPDEPGDESDDED